MIFELIVVVIIMSSDRSSDVTDVSPLATPKEVNSSSFSKHHHHHSSTRGHPPPAATATRLNNNRWSNNTTSNKDADRIDTTVFYDALSSEFTKKLGGGSGSGNTSWKHGTSLNQTIDLSSSSYGPKLLRLEAENQKLYERLLRESKKSSSSSSSRGRRGGLDRKSSSLTSSFRLTSSALNRQREQQRIEKENQLILRRLLDVKPSRDLQKEHQLRDYERNFGYLSLKMLPVASASANSSFAPRSSTAVGGASTTTTHRSSSKRSSAKSSANNSRISSAKSTGMRSAVTFEDEYQHHHHHGNHGYHDDPHDVLKRTASLSRRPEWSDRW